MALVKIFSFPNVGLRWLSEFSFTFAIAGLAFRSLSFFFLNTSIVLVGSERT